MGNWEDEMLELGGLWLSKTGKSWTGTLDADILAKAKPPFRVMMLKNHKHQEGDKRPPFRLVLNIAPPRGDFRAEQEEDRARSEAAPTARKPIPDDELF